MAQFKIKINNKEDWEIEYVDVIESGSEKERNVLELIDKWASLHSKSRIVEAIIQKGILTSEETDA